MRKEFVNALMQYADNPKLVFLTGDLGYKALEPLQAKMGKRFINAGIAEQNMVTVAAGLASEGDRSWCYSIAPFLYKRAFEQIANDVCEMNQPVMLVGNGAGYGYGVMGPSHHAINDYGVLLTLPNIKCMVPAFASDIAPMVEYMMTCNHPCYLRLGASEEPKDYVPPKYKAWRQLSNAGGSEKAPVVVVVGSIVGSYINALKDIARLWVVTEVPITSPSEFHGEFDCFPFAIGGYIQPKRTLIVIEEHVQQGSCGTNLISYFARYQKCVHICAQGYPSGLMGSKEFHRKESGLDVDSVVATVKSYA
jgi:transketolase